MKAEYLPITFFLPLLGLSFFTGYIPLLIPFLFGLASIFTFLIYYKDKSAAISGEWRTPESRLHILSILGGWPGAIVAQQTLRHKTKKKSFRIVFWLTVIVNLSCFVWLHTPEGARLLHTHMQTTDSFLQDNFGSSDASKYLQYLTRFNVGS